jgi:hypothetical protein
VNKPKRDENGELISSEVPCDYPDADYGDEREELSDEEIEWMVADSKMGDPNP